MDLQTMQIGGTLRLQEHTKLGIQMLLITFTMNL